jgi:hypothetical protein
MLLGYSRASANFLLAGLAITFPVAAQINPAIRLHPIPRFSLTADSLVIRRAVEPQKPFTVAGPSSALLGEQSGELEAWLFPVKILNQLAITAELTNYGAPIDVNAQGAEIEVTPAMTTITYSHAAFTIKQHMFTPRSPSAPGLDVLFEIASVRPLELAVSFRPEMRLMWPAPNSGIPSAEWNRESGYYVLHTDNPAYSAAVAIPGA